MSTRNWQVGLLLAATLVMLVAACAPPAPAVQATNPETTPRIQIVKEDPAPDPFVGASYYGLVWNFIWILIFAWVFIQTRRLRNEKASEWGPELRWGATFLAALCVIFAVVGSLEFVSDFAVTWWAYQEMGYLYRWQLELVSRTGLLVGVGLLTFLLLGLLVRPLVQSARAKLEATEEPPKPGPSPTYYSDGWERKRNAWRAYRWLKGFPVVVKGLIGFASLIVGLIFAGEWLTFLKFLNQVPWGSVDPVFGRDISFYVFTWSMVDLVYNILYHLLYLGIIGVASGYFVLNWDADEPNWTPALHHLGNLAACWLLVNAFGQVWSRFTFLFNEGAKYSGIATTQFAVELTAKVILAGLTILVTLVTWLITRRADRLLVYFQQSARPRWQRWLIAGSPFLGLLVAAVALLMIWPGLYHAFNISPREDVSQAEQVTWNIEATRRAFGLDQIEEREYKLQPFPDRELLNPEEETWRDVRLWDWRIVERFLDLRQYLQPVYDFRDTDVTRMWVTDGEERRAVQLMISHREPEPRNLPAAQITWPVTRIRIIGGRGWAGADPSDISPERYPELIAENLPIEAAYPELRVDQFRTYFSEASINYSFALATEDEYDIPVSEGVSTFYRYEGSGGVRLNLLNRLALGWHLKSWKVLVGTYFEPRTRILLNRNIVRRVQAIAPFFEWEYDPYIAVANDQFYFLWDGYTVTDRYPEATRYRLNLPDTPWRKGHRPEVRYARNSVKVAIDAYNGNVKFFIADVDDPIVKTLARIFPEMFAPMSQMPTQLREQVRYPETLFDTQLDVMQRYHVTDPNTFYGGRERWMVAEELADLGQTGRIESRYILIRLPGEEQMEFVLVNSFSPLQTRNLIAWMAARNDGEYYGRLILFKFAAGKQITGPADAEHRADTEGPIAAAIRNWEAAGANTVLPGNLIVLPVGDSILYVEPIHVVPNDPKAPATLNLVAIIPPEGRPAYHVDLPRALKALRGEIASYAPVIAEAGEQPATVAPVPLQPQLTPSADCATLRQQITDALARYDAGETAAAEEIVRIALELALNCRR